jgi:hypothetical protein
MDRINSMPKGSLHEKKRGRKVYYYLKYRDDEGKRIDQYVKFIDVEAIKEQLIKRNEYMKIVKSLKEDIEVAKRGLR